MGTEQFTRVVPAVGHGENIAIQGQAWGSPVTGTQAVNAPGSKAGIAPAGLFSTAPYVDPAKVKAERVEEREAKTAKNRCRAKSGTCRGFADSETGLCLGHRKKLEREGSLPDLASKHVGG